MSFMRKSLRDVAKPVSSRLDEGSTRLRPHPYAEMTHEWQELLPFAIFVFKLPQGSFDLIANGPESSFLLPGLVG